MTDRKFGLIWQVARCLPLCRPTTEEQRNERQAVLEGLSVPKLEALLGPRPAPTQHLFRGLFGTLELEVAAERVAINCLNEGTWLCPTIYDSLLPDQHERDGFLMLISSGLLVRGWRKCNYYVSQRFVNFVRNSGCWSDLNRLSENAPTTDEINRFELPSPGEVRFKLPETSP